MINETSAKSNPLGSDAEIAALHAPFAAPVT
jgi:hypothetical protein